MPETHIEYTCPYCQTRHLEAVATLPFVRGTGLGAQFHAKTIVGCRACVRKQLLLESLRSSVDGWGSPVAVLANPVLIAYGVARAGMVRKDTERLRAMLHAAGIRDHARDREPVRIAYALAAALIVADGKILQEEIAVASAIGKRLFADFDEQEFIELVAAGRGRHEPAELAAVLRGVVNEATKRAVYKYLVAIAAADNDIAPEEHGLLRTIAQNLGINEPGSGVDRSA